MTTLTPHAAGATVEGLTAAVDALLATPSADLPETTALDRLSGLLVQVERLRAAVLDAVSDLERRQLFALDDAGSAVGWLRRQRVAPASAGLVTAARRLQARPALADELAGGRLSGRAVEQLTAALEAVPDRVDEPTLHGVLTDGVRAVLDEARAGAPGTPAQVAELDQLLAATADATHLAADARLEPVFTLLATRLAPATLTGALRSLVEALQPDTLDEGVDPVADFFLDLADTTGGTHVRGFLDHETAHGLSAELARRLVPAPDPDADVSGQGDLLTREAAEPAAAMEPSDAPPPAVPPIQDSSELTGGAVVRQLSISRQRALALRQLVRDAATVRPGSGHPAVHLTVHATLDTLTGSPGALPAHLADGTPLGTATAQRLRCDAQLAAVLRDAAGRPVGASHTRRTLDKRERRALHSRWGPRCAIDGCPRPWTVPHHAEPWALTGLTSLTDTAPVCDCCHHDIHEGGRTLRLRDGRVLGPTGWVS